LIKPQDITALVLAGGKSRRMGGRDKGLLPFGDGLLVERVLAGILPQVATALISANRNQDAYRRLGFPVIADPLDDFQGPLAGFLAGLENMRTDYLLTLPCDGPVIAGDLAQRLATGLIDAGADIAVAHDGHRLQPVYAMLHRRVLPDLRLALEQGERKIDRWYPRNQWITVDFSDVPEQFNNINTPEDYAGVSQAPGL
jgi:molybdenum cofactor guanylyltransferase